MLKILKNDKKKIFSESSTVTLHISQMTNENKYRHLKYSKAVNMWKFYWHSLKIKETSIFSKKVHFFWDTLYNSGQYDTPD